MTKHKTGQLEAVYLLYVAAVGLIAATDYMTGWNALADGLMLDSSVQRAFYLVWGIGLLASLPERFAAVVE